MGSSRSSRVGRCRSASPRPVRFAIATKCTALPTQKRLDQARLKQLVPWRGAHAGSANTWHRVFTTAVLSATTFCTFVREFSPLGLSSDRVEEDTPARRRRRSPSRVLTRQGFRHSESWGRGQARPSDSSEVASNSRTVLRPQHRTSAGEGRKWVARWARCCAVHFHPGLACDLLGGACRACSRIATGV